MKGSPQDGRRGREGVRIVGKVLSILALVGRVQAGDRSGLEALTEWASPALRQVNERLEAIAQELPLLPEPPGVPSGNTSGFQTRATLLQDGNCWVEVELPQPDRADTVVLVPAVSTGAGKPVAGFGFPLRFTVEATDDVGATHLLRDQTAADFPNPGMYPVVIRFSPTMVRKVRLTVVIPWQDQEPAVLALAEMMVLSGNRNLAVGANVHAPLSRESRPAWSRSNLVDMSSPLGLPVEPSTQASMGYHGPLQAQPEALQSVTLAWSEPQALTEIRLVPVCRHELPHWVAYGFPVRFRIEAAMEPDFSDRRTVLDRTGETQPSPGQNLLCARGDGRPARSLRLTVTRLSERAGDYTFALAEIQAYANGSNVARGATVMAGAGIAAMPGWSATALTDGLASRSRLLELPEWIRLLERRQLLEQEQARLREERAPVFVHAQQTVLRVASGAAGSMAMAAGWVLWRQRRQRERGQELMRERLARDLHDEIGSNLGSIALICTMASRPGTSAAEVRADLAEIEDVARESADSMRDMVAMLSVRRSAMDGRWLAILQHLAERLLHGVHLECSFPETPLHGEPDLETRREIYLFCKEVVYNAARHARARSLWFRIEATDHGLRIEIRDDGQGFSPDTVKQGHGLGNLRERALHLQGRFDLTSAPGKGTTVRLELPRTRRWSKA